MSCTGCLQTIGAKTRYFVILTVVCGILFISLQLIYLTAGTVSPPRSQSQSHGLFAKGDRKEYNFVETQNKRKWLMRNVCKEYKADLSKPLAGHYHMHFKRRMMYCDMYKVGLSSWRAAFWYAAGLIPSPNMTIPYGNSRTTGLTDITVSAAMTKKSYFNFVFFRNPWERLVSGYRDRVLATNYAWSNKAPCGWIQNKPHGAQDLTFTEFIKCILKGNPKTMDFHWRPQVYSCDMCNINYTVIGHMETFAEDSNFILRANGMNFSIGKSNSFANSSAAANIPHVAYKHWTSWYEEVPQVEIAGLKNMYYLDFIMHGYSSDVSTYLPV